MPATAQKSTEHVAGVDVLVNGTPLDPKWRDAMIEVKVVDSLTLPDMALIRIADPKGENVDTHPLQLGKDIEIKTSADAAIARRPRSSRARSRRSSRSSAPEGCTISVRAYDKSHKLNRVRKTRTFQQMSASDMVAQDRRRGRPDAQGRGDHDVVHEFFQQSNETDWDFVWRLALMHDYEVVVERHHDGVPPGQQGGRRRR